MTKKAIGSRVSGISSGADGLSDLKPETRNPKPSSRGMNMRDMKAQQMGRVTRRPLTRAANEYERRPDEPDIEPVDEIENGIIAHQTDGTFVVVPRKRDDDEDGRDCPDEEPPGWCET